MNRGLYIHIPFCQTICSYCDFCKFIYNAKFVDDYLNTLKKEMENYDISNISSIYIGGGTPSSLSCEELEKLLEMIKPYFYDGISYTFEANVENLTIDKIKILKKYQINRVSLGVQTFSEKLLKEINRHHTKNDVIRVIKDLKENGIDNINVDLIYALPNETIDDLKKDLQDFLSLDIKHISTYSLMVNKNTIFDIEGIKEQDEDDVRMMYDYITNELQNNGFIRYEVSNFSKLGYESKHNLIYWHNEEYYGIGCGASGYLNHIRYENTKSLQDYIKGTTRIYQENVTPEDEEFYKIMLGLRLKEGVDIDEHKYKDKLEDLFKRKLIERTANRIKVTDNNLFILDYILEKLEF